VVVEGIFSPTHVRGHPWEMFFIGLVYSMLAVFLSLWVFKGHASIVMVAFTVIAALPFVHRMISMEEEYDLTHNSERTLMQEHSRAICMFVLLFIGMVAGYSLLYFMLPDALVIDVFEAQHGAINADVAATGNFISPTAALSTILANNLVVLMLSVLFSFLYGAGALFIITWNASVMAAVIGYFIKTNLLESGGSYLAVTSQGLIRYLLHGIPEIAAFMVAGLASGIISFALLKHDWNSPNFKLVLKDASFLFMLSLVFVLMAGMIEVYITPVFY